MRARTDPVLLMDRSGPRIAEPPVVEMKVKFVNQLKINYICLLVSLNGKSRVLNLNSAHLASNNIGCG